MDIAHPLTAMLVPRSLAVVGASSRAGSPGRVLTENILDSGFTGELHLVNASHRSVLGRKSYRSLQAIDRPVDLAVVAVPAESVLGVIDQCRGLVDAVVLASPPPAETGAAARWRHALLRRARRARVRVLGPQSFGIIRPALHLNATLGAVDALAGRLALISQSGAIASAMVDFARAAGVGFSTVVALGEAIDVDVGELLEFALGDEGTDAILVYVENLRRARRFISALRAAARSKPVVVLKPRRAPVRDAHERAAIDADLVFDAALRRAGTVRATTYTQLFAAALMLSAGRIPRGERLAVLSNGRGPALMAADRAASLGLRLASIASDGEAPASRVGVLRAPVRSASRERGDARPVARATLPHGIRDLGVNASPSALGDAARALLAEPGVDALLALHVPMPASPSVDAARAVADVARHGDKPVLAAWLGAVGRLESQAALEAGGIIHFYTPENAVEAFAFLAAYRRNQALLLEAPPPQPEPQVPDMASAQRIRDRAAQEGRTTLSAGETQVLLAAFGIALPMALVRSPEAARAAARSIGYPVALDVEIDGRIEPVRRRVGDAAALARAFPVLATRGRRAGRPSVAIVRKPLASEAWDDPGAGVHVVRVILRTDPLFGPVIGVASLHAPMSPATLTLPPLNHRLARDLLAGAGMAEIAAEPALTALLLDVSAMACALPWLASIDLAPVLVQGDGVAVQAAAARIDARRPLTTERYAHMAIHPYPVELESDIALRDGAHVRVRPIRPEDAALEQAFVAGLSLDTRYMRFMQQLRELTPQMLSRFTQVDYDSELALVALEEAGSTERIVGVARYVGMPDGESVEFAIVVADAWQARGLGRELMLRLIECAKRRGYQYMIGNVLAVNTTMLAFVRGLGFAVRRDARDPEQMIATLGLAAAGARPRGKVRR